MIIEYERNNDNNCQHSHQTATATASGSAQQHGVGHDDRHIDAAVDVGGTDVATAVVPRHRHGHGRRRLRYGGSRSWNRVRGWPESGVSARGSGRTDADADATVGSGARNRVDVDATARQVIL